MHVFDNVQWAILFCTTYCFMQCLLEAHVYALWLLSVVSALLHNTDRFCISTQRIIVSITKLHALNNVCMIVNAASVLGAPCSLCRPYSCMKKGNNTIHTSFVHTYTLYYNSVQHYTYSIHYIMRSYVCT